MKMTGVKAFPISVRIPEGRQNRIGIGRLTKRDAVIVRVETDEGVVGWGESHHGRNPGAIANIVDNAIGPLVLGMDPLAVTDAWTKVYRYQLASHGVGAGSVIAMSGVDMAMWDIRGKVSGWPLYRLLGGCRKGVPAYAGGGGALGFRPEAELAEEAIGFVEQGFKALKLRLGDDRRVDVKRVAAVRQAIGDEIVVLTDANAAYSLDDARYVIPALVELGVSWLEEPFPVHDIRSYQTARSYGNIPFAVGENNYTRFEFTRLIEEGLFQVLQPDVAKAGGVTEIMRIAATASAWKIPIHPHGGVTGLDHAAGIHVLASIENSGYFESSEGCNPLREGPFLSRPYQMDADGLVYPLEAPGIGLEVDEAFLAANPLIEGPGFG